jgi:hypothetical protein
MAPEKGRKSDAPPRREVRPRRMARLAPRTLRSNAGTQYTMGPDMEKPDTRRESLLA